MWGTRSLVLGGGRCPGPWRQLPSPLVSLARPGPAQHSLWLTPCAPHSRSLRAAAGDCVVPFHPGRHQRCEYRSMLLGGTSGLSPVSGCHERYHGQSCLPLLPTCPVLLRYVPEGSCWLIGWRGLDFTGDANPPSRTVSSLHSCQRRACSLLYILCQYFLSLDFLIVTILMGGQRQPMLLFTFVF